MAVAVAVAVAVGVAVGVGLGVGASVGVGVGVGFFGLELLSLDPPQPMEVAARIANASQRQQALRVSIDLFTNLNSKRIYRAFLPTCDIVTSSTPLLPFRGPCASPLWF